MLPPVSSTLVPSLLVLALGATLGSFGNVVVLRGEKHESLGGRSHCPRCKRQLGWLDLIPVLSFLALRGRCRGCKGAISVQYPLVEAASAALFLMAFLTHGWHPLPSLLLALAFWLLLLAAVSDLRTGEISDAVSMPFILCAALHALASGTPPWIPAAVGGGVFLLQWAVSRGRWVGTGDILLGLGIGALAGNVPRTVLALFLAYILGAVVASVLLCTGKKTLQGALPFGPFLAAGAFVAVLWGDALLSLVFS